MKRFCVYFKEPGGPKEYLDSFDTLPQGNQYIRQQLALEGWQPGTPEASQYLLEDSELDQ